MSEAAAGRPVRNSFLISALKIGLPVLIGLLLAFLALAPLERNEESSFLLDKNKVDTAPERMRVENAQYRGVDEEGRPFTLNASTAVQARSTDPLVEIAGMNAQLQLREGPAQLRADRARYNMEEQRVDVLGPIQFEAADGYTLTTSDVAVDLRDRTLQATGRVSGQMPLGRFEAGSLSVDLPERRVVLEGRARLHIVQGALR